MGQEQNKNLTRWIVILPLLGVLITTLILVNVFIDFERKVYKENIFQANSETIKKNKIIAQERVENITNFIAANEKILKKKSKDEVRSLTNFAMKIIESTYKENKNLSKSEILKKIKTRLRDIRFFDNLSGYFFIYDLNGKCLLLPPNASLENTNLFTLKDAKGKFTIQSLINISKEKGEGFDTWWWYKPNEKVMKQKIGFVKAFKPLNIFIGTAIYEEDIMDSIKREMQQLLINTRYGESGYIFAYDYSGKTISHIIKDYIDVNRWDTLVEGGYQIAHLIRGAKFIPEGFFMSKSEYPNKADNTTNNKISFVKDIPELGWVMGISTYDDYISKEIDQNSAVLEARLSHAISKIIYFTLAVLLLILLTTLLVSSKLKKVLKTYQQTLIAKNKQTTEQKQQIIHQLEHDHLTNLPNRILLEDRLKQAINHAKREKKTVAVLFIDIDNFKTINDSLGHDSGDELLRNIAKRLQNSIRLSDTAARLGGDEFIVLIDGYETMHDVTTVVEKIRKEIKKEMLLGDKSLHITASIGISIFPSDGKESKTLLKNADIAMYKAKENGRDQYRFFTSKIDKELQQKIEIEQALHVAIENREFVLHYQPIVDMNNGKIVGVEALVRWQHPTRGLIFPDEFIPIAEESRLIIYMGHWIIDEAIEQMSKWKAKGYKLEKMSINIAGRQLEDQRLIQHIKNALQKNSCRPEWIEVEVIERFIMKNTKKTISILQALRAMNIDIALDDFGTGYSSLAYLKQLPITKLKIDRAFVKNILTSFEDRAIAKAIIALGLGLDIKVLAEGVEKQEEKEFFEANGCHLIQGYLYSKPLPLHEVEKLLALGKIV